MKIVIGTDHAGFLLKEDLKKHIIYLGHQVLDVGTFDETPVDYPDFAKKVAMALIEAKVERGILLCGSGVGAGIAANKIRGIRASVCHDTYSAHQGVEHDDMNVLVLGARVIGNYLAMDIVKAFLHAHFSNEERHKRRLEKVMALEQCQYF
ncbi:MAG TPA: ribose 5-phosphate isomerase B [Myxococcota bacterium]|nr:ribose 5-phosphate isomerase B [Myxococcota bacterium]